MRLCLQGSWACPSEVHTKVSPPRIELPQDICNSGAETWIISTPFPLFSFTGTFRCPHTHIVLLRLKPGALQCFGLARPSGEGAMFQVSIISSSFQQPRDEAFIPICFGRHGEMVVQTICRGTRLQFWQGRRVGRARAGLTEPCRDGIRIESRWRAGGEGQGERVERRVEIDCPRSRVTCRVLATTA